MAIIEAGPFIMGDGDGPPLGPRRTVALDSFAIDRTEVTVAEYLKCAEAGICPVNAELDNPNAGKPDYPVTVVSWRDAAAYCAFAGKRLPTEAEWERAARGKNGRRYPWGDEPPDGRANFIAAAPDPENRFLTPVGAFPEGATPEGIYDLAGNVAEWTADAFRSDYHLAASATNPPVDSGSVPRTLRGGDFRTDAEGLLAFQRDGNRTELSRGFRVGFRCAKDVTDE